MPARLWSPKGRDRALGTCLLCAVLAAASAAPGSPRHSAPAAGSPRAVPCGVVAGALALTAVVGSLSGDRGDLLPRPARRRDTLYSAALDRVGTHRLTGDQLDLYGQLQDRLRASLAFDPTFARPPARSAEDKLNADTLFVNPDVSKRLVPVVDDRLAHFEAALICDPPQLRWQQAYKLPPACTRAITVMLQKGKDLKNWRGRQVHILHQVAKQARRLDAALKAEPSPSSSVRHLEDGVRSVNVALLCLLCDVLDHPDVDLPRNFLLGFPVTGVIADSGVLRPQPPDGSDADFWRGHASTMASNASWAARLASDVQQEADNAKGKQLRLLRDTWELTQQEIAKGFAGQPMTLAQLQTRYRSSAGSLTCRPLRRHGVKQGQKQAKDAGGAPVFNADGSPRMVDKIRLIDDSKRSFHNSTLIRCCETIAPCRFTYMGYVADEVHRQAAALGQPAPALVFSLDDMQVSLLLRLSALARTQRVPEHRSCPLTVLSPGGRRPTAKSPPQTRKCA